LAFPAVYPITPQTMNYASAITVGVMILSGIWYIAGAHNHYSGPQPNVDEHTVDRMSVYEEPGLASEERDVKNYSSEKY
jgi:hypothetical protein